MRLPSIVLIAIVLSLTACAPGNEQGFSAPQKRNDGWDISTPQNSGFDRDKLEKLFRKLPGNNEKLNSLVIARHGKLVVDQYYNHYAPDSLQKIWSVTKVVTGTIIGIAHDKGLLSEKDRIYQYLDDYIPDASAAKAQITIEHLLTMTSGFEWVELGGPKSAGFQLAYSNDWIAFILSQPHTNNPGSIFNYATGNTMLLAPIINKATGKQADEFADEYLFSQLGIVDYAWDKQSEFWTKTQNGELPGAKLPGNITYKMPFADLSNTGSGLRMRPRDLCKLGQLYLNKGKWNDKQIISEEWILRSTQPHFGNQNFGYHWRLMDFHGYPCYYATGFGLQRIFVFPKQDLVVVLTQQHYETMPEGEKWTNLFLKGLFEAIVD